MYVTNWKMVILALEDRLQVLIQGKFRDWRQGASAKIHTAIAKSTGSSGDWGAHR